MCGINCIWDPFGREPAKAQLVDGMNALMSYRGPDDSGIYSDVEIALGMRRLSIIDLTGGHQPLHNEDRSLFLVANGEIYNYVELTEGLRARGHQFISGSDTETILHLYEEKGEHCLQDLRGMFAFVLWDCRRHRLFAARDRMGIKPLYFSEQNGLLWLSSELKAIVAAADISPTLDARTVYQFLLYGYAIDQRQTVVQEVQRVLPGEYLIADTTGVHKHRYWSPRFGGDSGIANRTDDEILDTLKTAVQLHLRSDVPVGVLLSGGVDSSGIAAIAAHSSDNYKALCAGYTGEAAVDERRVAHATAQGLGLDYLDVVLDTTLYGQYFDQVVSRCDEPIGDLAAMPQWALYKRAREMGFKVVLSGIGGDEVFFGYPFWNLTGAKSQSAIDKDRADWVGLDQRYNWKAEWDCISGMMKPSTALTNVELHHPLFALRDEAPWGPDAMASVLFGTYLVHNGCLLADKLGMGCSVEVRVPYLDHLLVESVLSLPLGRRFSLTTNKPLLKAILRGIVPDGVLGAAKRGFTPPLGDAEHLVLSRSEQIRDGILAHSLLESTQLEALFARTRALPWLNIGRVRRWLAIDRPLELLFRIIAFEAWWDELRHSAVRFEASRSLRMGETKSPSR